MNVPPMPKTIVRGPRWPSMQEKREPGPLPAVVVTRQVSPPAPPTAALPKPSTCAQAGEARSSPPSTSIRMSPPPPGRLAAGGASVATVGYRPPVRDASRHEEQVRRERRAAEDEQL